MKMNLPEKRAIGGRGAAPEGIRVSSPLLEFANFTVVKGSTKLLDAISLSVDEGENIAILGPNGAGKSSLIKTINREYYPASPDMGVTFRVRGKESWDVFDLRSAIGIVSNDLQFSFARDLTVR